MLMDSTGDGITTMSKGMIRSLVVASLATIGAAAHAVTFYNVIIASPPLSNGSSWSSTGNAINFYTPNAILMDGAPAAFVPFSIQYDADMGTGNSANQVGVNLAVVTAGSGFVQFTEQVFELDNANNEVGGPIGTDAFLFNPNTPVVYSNDIALSRSVQKLRVKKTFFMNAADVQNQLDLAAIQIVNQNVVPEPSALAALGLGLIAVARRRRSK